MLSSLVFRYTTVWKMCMQCPSFSQNTQIRLVLPLQVLDLLQRSLTTLSPPHSCGGCCTASTVCFLSMEYVLECDPVQKSKEEDQRCEICIVIWQCMYHCHACKFLIKFLEIEGVGM